MAFLLPLALFAAPLIKKETVSGIIGKTQGVKRAINPPKKPKINTNPLPESSFTCSVPQFTSGFLKSSEATLRLFPELFEAALFSINCFSGQSSTANLLFKL